MSEQDGFSDFVRAHTSDLLRSAYLLTGDVPLAEDLVQDTLLILYPKWARVRQAQLPLAYVRRSMANAFINSRRGKYNAARREVLFSDPPDRAVSTDPIGPFSDAQLVEQLLASLAARPRAVLVLRYLHDLSDEQIATDLGMRAGSVRSIISRALATLREQLEQTQLSAHPKYPPPPRETSRPPKGAAS
ncbi:MAG: subfamily polymerase sigma-24 subunit [Frankiales bacterium]|nr:subfamily polymerase sigma-24 subunit [Frankiales bacterium]